ncbi:cell division protein FtsQ/DivIB [Fervidibacter sacchari]
MRRGWLKLVKFGLLVGAIVFATKGLAVRQVLWEGCAPIGLDKVADVNGKLLGRPIWLVSEKQVRQCLEGEMIGELKVRKRLPCTVVIVVEPPQLVGVIAKGSEGIVVDERGRKWRKVPLSATRLPFLMLPGNVPVQKCMVAVERVLKLCAQEEIPVRAIWLSQFGEAAIYLPESVWIKLGNPTALPLKVRLGKLLRQNNLIRSNTVADLSVPRVVSLLEMK